MKVVIGITSTDPDRPALEQAVDRVLAQLPGYQITLKAENMAADARFGWRVTVIGDGMAASKLLRPRSRAPAAIARALLALIDGAPANGPVDQA